jgi:hypothetical protein
MPFTGLTKFGGSFLSKFECSQMPHPVRINCGIGTCWIRYKFILTTDKQCFFFEATRAYYLCRHSRSSIWWKATDPTQLWFHWCNFMVCYQVWPHPSSVWSSQAWYKWWVQTCHFIFTWTWWQDKGSTEQGGPSWHSTGWEFRYSHFYVPIYALLCLYKI